MLATKARLRRRTGLSSFAPVFFSRYQLVLKHPIHYRVDGAHDNPHCLTLRLKPFGQLRVSRKQCISRVRANLVDR
jgi:hypothetical protein